MGHISRDLDDRGYDEGCAGYAEDHSCNKSRSVVIFPDAEDGKRPVDGYGHEREEEPKSRDRLDLVDISPEWVNCKAGEQAEIDSETPRANRELLVGDVK